MQSTGHSSMHALSSTSTQGCAMMWVTGELLSPFLSSLLFIARPEPPGPFRAESPRRQGLKALACGTFCPGLGAPSHLRLRGRDKMSWVFGSGEPTVCGTADGDGGGVAAGGLGDLGDRLDDLDDARNVGVESGDSVTHVGVYPGCD